MAWKLTSDLDAFDAAAGPLLAADPVRNTLLLTIAAAVRSRGLDAFGEQPPHFGWYTGPDGAASAAFLQTPPYPLVLTTLPDGAAEELVGALAAVRRPVTGVNGPVADAERFVQAFTQASVESASAQASGAASGETVQTGATAGAGAWRVVERLRLYLLGDLVDPDPMPVGGFRLAEPRDTDLLVEWLEAFAVDTRAPTAHVRGLPAAIERGSLGLWEVDGGPVALAGVNPSADGSVRVGPVYTPPRLRGRGYAGAATAAMSRLVRERGAPAVVLFTDLANPTSNALYLRLGYRPVEDRVVLAFES